MVRIARLLPLVKQNSPHYTPWHYQLQRQQHGHAGRSSRPGLVLRRRHRQDHRPVRRRPGLHLRAV